MRHVIWFFIQQNALICWFIFWGALGQLYILFRLAAFVTGLSLLLLVEYVEKIRLRVN
jgi:hypothetical protein